MSCLVHVYLDFLTLVVSSRVAFSVPPSTFSILPPCLTLFLCSSSSPSVPPLRLEVCFRFGRRRSLVLGLYSLLLYQAETSVNTLFCHPSVRLSKLLFVFFNFSFVVNCFVQCLGGKGGILLGLRLGWLGLGSLFFCISRCIGLSLSLSLSLPPSSFFLLSFREQFWLRIPFLKITAPSPRSSPQGATV